MIRKGRPDKGGLFVLHRLKEGKARDWLSSRCRPRRLPRNETGEGAINTGDLEASRNSSAFIFRGRRRRRRGSASFARSIIVSGSVCCFSGYVSRRLERIVIGYLGHGCLVQLQYNKYFLIFKDIYIILFFLIQYFFHIFRTENLLV